MKVFISSLIIGMEALRAAAKVGVVALGHEPVMAEEFGAVPRSPQVACLDGVRQAAMVVLVLGNRYGGKQASGISATHEEYREARTRCPVLAFVQEPVTPEPDQAAFIAEVQAWGNGLYRDDFTDAASLQSKVTRAIHRSELASASNPFDAKELLGRALDAFPSDRHRQSYGTPELSVVVVGGPAQAVLRPSQMEDPALAERLEQEALYGPTRIFARGSGTTVAVNGSKLTLEQNDLNPRSLTVDAQGGVLVRQPIGDDTDQSFGHSVIVVETIKDRLAAALRFSVWLLDSLDATQRLSHLVVATRITGGFAVMTRRERQASPRSIQMSSFGQEDRPAVHLTPAHILRPQLAQGIDQIVEDLTTLLRQQWR